MKKIFVGLLAIAALAACQKNETISVVGTPAITFENAAVNNATRAAVDPSTTTSTISELSVYGFMNEVSGVVFNNETVSKEGNTWGYVNTQYWTPGNTYYFAAISPLVTEDGPVAVDYSKASTDGVGVLTFTQPEDAGSVDVLYDAKVVECGSNDMAPVGFNMNHLLSKVKFSFTNGFGNDNAYIKVTNIRMSAPASASINLAQANWWSTNQWVLAEGETVLEFGDMEEAMVGRGAKTESAKERLTIPTSADQEYNVTFDVALYYGEVRAYTNTLTTVITGAALEIGKAYNFHATIDASNIVPGEGEENELKPIEFTVETVKDWVDGNGYDGGDIKTLPTLVNTVVEAGGSLVLTSDAVIGGTIALAGTLDGAEKTLYAAAEPTDNGLIRPSGDVVIKNVTIDGKGLAAGNKTLRGLYINANGNYVVENVVITGCGYALNVGGEGGVTEATLTVTNSTFEGWTSYSETMTASFTNVAFTAGQYARIRPYGTTTFTNCSFVEGFVIDLAYLGTGKTVKFVNCTYNGAALTAANLTGAVDGTYTIE